MLTGKNIYKSYGPVKVLKGVDIAVQKGEVVSIAGPSGSGKSTLLHILGTLDKADGGTVSMNNLLVNTLSSKKMAAFRNKHIGFYVSSAKAFIYDTSHFKIMFTITVINFYHFTHGIIFCKKFISNWF